MNVPIQLNVLRRFLKSKTNKQNEMETSKEMNRKKELPSNNITCNATKCTHTDTHTTSSSSNFQNQTHYIIIHLT